MYLVMYTTLSILTFYDTFIKSNEKIKKIIFIFLNIILIIISSIRNYIGTDYGTYVEIFNGINNIDDYSYIEIGFRVIIILIKNITSNSNLLFAVMATISMIYFYKGIEKLSNKKLVSIFIYFNVFYISYIFNAIRQGLAMSIFIYSINYFEKEDLKKILVLTLIASSIHSSGIYILIAYILRNFEIKEKYYIHIVLIGILICIFNPFEILIANIPIFSIKEKFIAYSVYFESISIVDILQRVIILVIFMKNSRKFKDNDKRVFNIYILGWIFYCVFSFQIIIATRVNMFFRVLEVILFANIIDSTKDKLIRLLIYMFIILWSSAILIISLQNPDNYPYKIINIISVL